MEQATRKRATQLRDLLGPRGIGSFFCKDQDTATEPLYIIPKSDSWFDFLEQLYLPVSSATDLVSNVARCGKYPDLEAWLSGIEESEIVDTVEVVSSSTAAFKFCDEFLADLFYVHNVPMQVMESLPRFNIRKITNQFFVHELVIFRKQMPNFSDFMQRLFFAHWLGMLKITVPVVASSVNEEVTYAVLICGHWRKVVKDDITKPRLPEEEFTASVIALIWRLAKSGIFWPKLTFEDFVYIPFTNHSSVRLTLKNILDVNALALKSFPEAADSYYKFEYSKTCALLESIHYKKAGSPDDLSNKLLVNVCEEDFRFQ